MNPDPAAWKLILGYVVWLLPSIAIAFLLALLVGSIASLVGVNGQSTAHQHVVEVAGIAFFAALAAAPFIMRIRSNRTDPDVTD